MPHEMAELLIAYDGSEPARRAVAAAAALLPGSRATVLTVAHAIRAAEAPLAFAPMGGRAVEQLERAADEDALAVAREGEALATGAGLAAQAATAIGAPGVWAAILHEAEARQADAVVCGTRGQGALGHAMLGSTSTGVLHHAQGSVLIVPQLDALPEGPVVLAYDGSEHAQFAIVEAARLLPGREVLVVHAYRSLLRETVTGRAFLAAPVEDVRDLAGDLEALEREAAEERVEEGRVLAEQHGLVARSQLVDATHSHWHGILEAAAAADAALLVAGSRGRGGIATALLGSVSSSLAHNATRPTLIVRPAA